MKNALAILAAPLVLFTASCGDQSDPSAAQPPAANYADLVIHGGPIYTGASDGVVEAVAVKDSRISAVGAYGGLESMIGGDTRVIDLGGAAMYPGFTDSHAHLFAIGRREMILNLEGVSSVEELVDIVAASAVDSAPGETISGLGWIETGWPENRFPNRDDLDAVTPDNPVVLTRADGHALVANSAALDAAGIDDDTPNPDGGRIERDANGRATGILIDAAMQLVASLIETPSPQTIKDAYRLAGEVYAGYGWTGMHNMSVEPGHVAVMEEMSNRGEMNIRVYNALNPDGLSMLEQGGPRANLNTRVVTRAVKLFADGALGSRGAALFEPYTDEPDTDGLLLMNHDEARALMDRAVLAGAQICTHAIGDRGNRLALDWYEETFGANSDAGDLRWRIEHAQILDAADIPRFAQLDVIPSMQPSHAIGDLFFAPARLGPDRLAGAYAWRSLIDAGSIIAGGSDAPVERGDPLIEFYAAVARRGLDGTQTPQWRPEEAVTRDEALKMFTVWPAYASFQENQLGTIEVGKQADFTAFSKDIMSVAESEILNAEPVLTIVAGDIIFEGDTAQSN
ncbi:MAG: amidohydrolase [Parvularculaceae bacterium]|nr:amidohydrolase [Parvularculaceae bacterium]